MFVESQKIPTIIISNTEHHHSAALNLNPTKYDRTGDAHFSGQTVFHFDRLAIIQVEISQALFHL